MVTHLADVERHRCVIQIGPVILITYLFPYHVAQACARLLGLPWLHGSINTGIPSVPADTSISTPWLHGSINTGIPSVP